jgi:hypothetical protein
MTGDDAHKKALNEAIAAATAHMLADGEIVVSWVVVAATRNYTGGGAVITVVGDDGMPQWEARGLLATAMRSVDHQEGEDRPSEEGT